MNDIIAGRQSERRLRQRSIRRPSHACRRLRALVENPPVQAGLQRRAASLRTAERCKIVLPGSAGAFWAPAGANAQTQARKARKRRVTKMPMIHPALPRSSPPVNGGAWTAARASCARQTGRLMTVYSGRQTGQGTADARRPCAAPHFENGMPMNETIELLRRRRSLPPQGMTGPGPSARRNRDPADDRLARARSRQARALAFPRVRGRRARQGRRDRRRYPASATIPRFRRRACRPN